MLAPPCSRPSFFLSSLNYSCAMLGIGHCAFAITGGGVRFTQGKDAKTLALCESGGNTEYTCPNGEYIGCHQVCEGEWLAQNPDYDHDTECLSIGDKGTNYVDYCVCVFFFWFFFISLLPRDPPALCLSRTISRVLAHLVAACARPLCTVCFC